MISIHISVQERFAGLNVLPSVICGLKVKEKGEEGLKSYRSQVFDEVREKYDLETIKDDVVFKKYRKFFWKLGIDPTKKRPASEALVRRILQGKTIPEINTLVDAYNLASIKTAIPLAAFDMDHLVGDLLMRFAKEGETFTGIGMKKPILLSSELVIVDEEKVIAVYPYRDADITKVGIGTSEILLLSCGVPGIENETLEGTLSIAEEIITRFCGGIVVPG